MSIKLHPFETWDGKAIDDPIRAALCGESLLFCAACCLLKGDWAEFCTTVGFTTWTNLIAPCFCCWATKANYLQDEAFGAHTDVWPDFTWDDYVQACVDSERKVLVSTTTLLKRIVGALFYDRREKGSHGRALRWDITGTSLLAGDRLEPSQELTDVGRIDSLTSRDLPILLTFWRCSVQERVKHRNPLFDATIGITPRIMTADLLHAYNLGCLMIFCRELVWQMFWDSVWCDRRNRVQAEWVELSVIGLRAELVLWEREYARCHPEHKHTQIQKLEPGHFGLPSRRCLNIKAAETKKNNIFCMISWWGLSTRFRMASFGKQLLRQPIH